MAALLVALALWLAPCARAQAFDAAGVRCGGSYAGKDLAFKFNPTDGLASAASDDDDLLVYIDLSTKDRVRVAYTESISDEDWALLQAARGEPGSRRYDLFTRLGSAQITQLWTGFSPDGYLHLEVAQKDLSFSISCTLLKASPSGAKPPQRLPPGAKQAALRLPSSGR